MKKTLIGLAVAATALTFSVGVADAAPENARSVCADDGERPDGEIAGGPETGTWANPGEGLSIIARAVGGLKGGVGPTVAAICNPN